LDGARQALERALEIWERLARKSDADRQIYEPKVAMTLNDLGNVFAEQIELERARRAYDRALEIRERLALRHPRIYAADVAGSLTNLARVCRELGEWNAAEAALRQATRWVRFTPRRLSAADILDSVGRFFLWDSRSLHGTRYAVAALGKALRLGEEAIAALSHGEESRLDLHKRRLETAFTFGVYKAASRNGNGKGRLVELLESLRQVERRALEWGVEVDGRRRGKPERGSAGMELCEKELREELIAQAMRKQRERIERERAEELEALRRHDAALLYVQPTPRGVVLTLVEPEGRANTVIAPCQFKQLMEALFLLICRLPRFGTRNASPGRPGNLGPRQPVAADDGHAVASMSGRQGVCVVAQRPDRGAWLKRVYDLAREAWRLLAGACPEVSRWLDQYGPRLWISPHGSANHWPLELLNDGGKFLGLEHALPRAVGLRGLVQYLQRSPAPGPAVIVGNPTGDLTNAQKSAEQIHGLLPKPGWPESEAEHRLISKGDARRTDIVTALTDPQLSFFLYTGHGALARSGAVAVLPNDEVLTCHDLRELSWCNAPWVHLDCCQGGLGQYGGGGRLDGLTYAALGCGASAVLGCHHSVGDWDSARFAEVFYSHWLREGCTAAEALLAARRALYDEAEQDVLIWALPVLNGNARVRSPWVGLSEREMLCWTICTD